MTGIALVFAKRSRAEAHSRICVTLPGADSTSSVSIVCMESMTINSGATSSISLKMFSSDVSQSIMTCSPASGASRSARILI